MKITHQGPTALPVLHNRGGAIERRMMELAASQVEAGHEVTILSCDRSTAFQEVRGVQVQSIRTRTSRPLRDYEMFLAERKFLKANPPDILHFHGVPDGARFTGHIDCPKVLQVDYFRFRGSKSRLGHTYYEGSLRRFARLLPVSRACSQEFCGFWGRPAPVEVVHNGVNAEQFRPDPDAGRSMREKLNLSGIVVLYVGRLCDQKGTSVLLDAWEQAAPAGARLVLAGPIGQFGMDRNGDVVNRMNSVGASYVGAIEDSQLAALYNACDLFVMPSLHDEMFGMAALEAQACGKPVVASRLGGLVEVVGEASGVLVPPGDASALGASLKGLAGDVDRLHEMGGVARLHALQFSWARIASDLQSVYESIL